MGRGDARKPAQSVPRSPASTGPRLLGRGDHGSTRQLQQFTSGFNGAAPFGARRSRECVIKPNGVSFSLQRGRAFWGAEIPFVYCRFNARTGLQRGRAFWGAEIQARAEGLEARIALQRGRAFWGAEMRDGQSGFRQFLRASTGPRLLGRGDRVGQLDSEELGGSFNGAAPFGARR